MHPSGPAESVQNLSLPHVKILPAVLGFIKAVEGAPTNEIAPNPEEKPETKSGSGGCDAAGYGLFGALLVGLALSRFWK